MKSEWTYRPLGELVSFASGGTPSKKRDDYWGGTIPWISAKTLKTENIDTSDLFITEEGLKAGSKIAPKGSILLLTRGSGLFNGIPIARVEKDVAFNQDIKCLDSYGEVENEFIFYWLLSQKDYLMAKVGVTGIGAGKFDLDFLQKLKNKQYQRCEQDGKIFYGFAPWHSVTELGVRVAMRIPFVEFSDMSTLPKFLKKLRQEEDISEQEYGMLEQNNFKLLIEYLQKNYFIVSTHSNERLIRQSGAFVLPTAIKIDRLAESAAYAKIEKSHMTLDSEFDHDYFIVPSKYKKKLRGELDFFNINESTMFPELEHQMTYLQQKSRTGFEESPEFEPYNMQVLIKKEPFVQEEFLYNDRVPNVKNVIESVVPDIPENLKVLLESLIKERTAQIDWKAKEQIRSKIRLDIKKVLQENYSARMSNIYAEKILAELLNPANETSEN